LIPPPAKAAREKHSVVLPDGGKEGRKEGFLKEGHGLRAQNAATNKSKEKANDDQTS